MVAFGWRSAPGSGSGMGGIGRMGVMGRGAAMQRTGQLRSANSERLAMASLGGGAGPQTHRLAADLPLPPPPCGTGARSLVRNEAGAARERTFYVHSHRRVAQSGTRTAREYSPAFGIQCRAGWDHGIAGQMLLLSFRTFNGPSAPSEFSSFVSQKVVSGRALSTSKVLKER